MCTADYCTDILQLLILFRGDSFAVSGILLESSRIDFGSHSNDQEGVAFMWICALRLCHLLLQACSDVAAMLSSPGLMILVSR